MITPWIICPFRRTYMWPSRSGFTHTGSASTGIFRLTYDLTGSKPVLTLLDVVPCQTGARGDYRPYELTEEAERKKCLTKLIAKKKVTKLDNLPASFADTGKVVILPDGKLADWSE